MNGKNEISVSDMMGKIVDSLNLPETRIEAEPNSRLSMNRHELLYRASFQELESPAGT